MQSSNMNVIVYGQGIQRSDFAPYEQALLSGLEHYIEEKLSNVRMLVGGFDHTKHDIASLRKHIKPHVNKCIVISHNWDDSLIGIRYPYIHKHKGIEYGLLISTLQVQSSNVEVPVEMVIFICGPDKQLLEQNFLSIGAGGDSYYVPDILEEHSRLISVGRSAIPTILKHVITIYTGPISDILEFLNSNTIPVEDRSSSLLYSIFPWVQQYCNTHYNIVSLDSVSPDLYHDSGITEGLNPEDGSQHSIALMILYTIAPSYTLRTKLAIQLASRASALCASENLAPPPEHIFTQLLVQTTWAVEGYTSEFDNLLAQVICVNERVEFNINITLSEIAPVDQLKAQYNLDSTLTALLTQMRLVYRHRHTTSTTMSIAAIKYAKTTLAHVGPEWKQELQRLEDVRESLVNSPFLGLTSTLPEKYRVVQFPRMIYYGVLVYRAHLSTDAEKNEFNNFKVDSIKAHISNHADIAIIEFLANLVPSAGVQALAQIVTIVSLDNAEQLLAVRSREEQMAVLTLCRSSPNKGAWATAKIAEEIRTYLHRVRSQIRSFHEMEKLKINTRLEKWTQEVDTMQERTERQRQAMLFLNEYSKAGEYSTSIEESIEQGHTIDERLAAEALLKEYKRGVDALTMKINLACSPGQSGAGSVPMSQE